ncbi:MAG: N-acyl homoserine lactone hydrolase [Limisphaerales bacterium]|jgi:N-acyl homoserine lactone hydrolase
MRWIATLTLCIIAFNVQANPKLYVFDCGYFKFADVSAFSLSNDETSVREMFVPCYLIEHEGGRLLWDGGLPLALAGMPSSTDDQGTTTEYQRSVIDQLADLSLSPKDIDLMAFSHFHYDHVGAANAFKDSHLLIQQTEYDAAFMHADENPVFDPALYNELSGTSKTLLNGDHDVFGDGSVRIISAPGHTPGHQTLLLDLANTGKIMLSGDLYHFEQSRVLRRAPTFNTDAEETFRSMDKVEAILKAEGATLWIEHSLELAKTLKKSPEYYD